MPNFLISRLSIFITKLIINPGYRWDFGHITLLTLSPRELLTTTRAVRKRLDLTRSVDRKVIEECITIAQQAPNASNMQN